MRVELEINYCDPLIFLGKIAVDSCGYLTCDAVLITCTNEGLFVGKVL